MKKWVTGRTIGWLLTLMVAVLVISLMIIAKQKDSLSSYPTELTFSDHTGS
ncbi:hypothetical protein [Hymenobacter sp. B81]|uniref:hypothetical protein n=1 Tax=Hymenobacter sp. B81 TaxID=3344878 RepID=UPI0037DD9EC5